MTSSHTPRLPIQAPEGIKSPVATATIADTDLQGLQTINGYQLNVNDRVLVMNQTEPAQNGIYSAQQGRWTRTQDWKVGFQIANGVLVLDINTGVLWRASFAGVLKIDVTPVTFTAVVSGAGSFKFIQEDLPLNNIEEGDQWYKPSEATTYIYYVDEDGGQWVEESVQSAEGTLRDELADSDSDVLVGGVEAERLGRKYDEIVNITDFIPSNEIAAIQAGTSTFDCLAAFNSAKAKGRYIHFPAGTYFVSAPMVLDGGTFNGYILQEGITVTGDGESRTIIKRSVTNDADKTYSDIESEYTNQAIFNVHGMYHKIEGMTLQGSKIGVFLGQDISSLEDTYVSKNRLKDLIIRDCGAGILASVEKGITYSLFEDLHIYRCQVGMRSRDGRWDSGSAPYFNRNKFKSIRFSRCWIGFWLSRGDTNTLYSVDAEGMVVDGNIANIPKPTGLPEAIPSVTAGVPSKSIAFLVEDAPYNKFFGSTVESSEVAIADFNSLGNRNDNQYIGCLFGESSSNPDKIFFTQPPTTWITDRSYSSRFESVGDNAYTDVDPDMGSGIKNHKVAQRYLEPTTIYGGGFDTGDPLSGGLFQKWENTGAVAAGATLTFDLPPALGNVNSFDRVEIELGVVENTKRIGANLKLEAVVSYNNFNNNALRVRIDKTSLSGFSDGGGTVFDETNSTYITASVSIVSGTVRFSFVNSSGENWDSSCVKTSITRVR